MMNLGKLFGKKSKHKSSKTSSNDERFETDRRNSSQVRERTSIQESLHSDAILSVCAVDPSTVLSGSQDRTIVLYDCLHHRIRRRWIGHEHDVVKVLYGHKNNLIVSASRDRTIRFWTTNSDTSVQKLQGHELVVTAIDFNPENSVLVSGSRDNKVIFWDTKSGQILKSITIGRNLITDVKWSHDGTFVVQTGEDKEIKIYDARAMSQVVSFPKKQYIQTSCDISQDNRFLLWDIRQRQLITEFNGHRATVNCGRFVDQTASMLVSCSNDGRAILWNTRQNSIFAELVVDDATPLTSIAVLNTHNFVTSGLSGKLNFVQQVNHQLQMTDQI